MDSADGIELIDKIGPELQFKGEVIIKLKKQVLEKAIRKQARLVI